MDTGHWDAERPTQLERLYRGVAERSAGACSCPAAILNLGAAVVFHGAMEQSRLFALNPFVDPSVLAELAAEHERLAEDLILLHSIWAGDPLSVDLPPLCAALLTRLREHIARDERLFYQSRLSAVRARQEG